MINLKILNEVSNEVERYNKHISRNRDDGSYDVPVGDFLEGLLYTRNIFSGSGSLDEWGEEKGQLNTRIGFTNPRINKKAYSVYFDVMDRINYTDFMMNVYAKIYDTIIKDELNFIHIDYNNYRENKDYISKLVFLIDKEVRREALEESGLVYNRHWVKEGSSMYFNPMGIEIRLDELHMNGDDECLSIEEIISTDDLLISEKTEEEKDIEDQKLNDLLDNVGLTKRQREYIDAFMLNNYSQAETAKYLDITPVASRKMIGRIRDVFANHYKINNVDQKLTKPHTTLENFDNMLDTPNLNDADIINFIKDNIDKDVNFEEMIYTTEEEIQKKILLKNVTESTIDLIDSEDVYVFLILFLKNYYDNYKIHIHTVPYISRR